MENQKKLLQALKEICDFIKICNNPEMNEVLYAMNSYFLQWCYDKAYWDKTGSAYYRVKKIIDEIDLGD